MSVSAMPRPWSPQEVLEWERQQPDRFEHVGGVLRMRLGGTLAHNLIVGAVAGALRGQLRDSGCRVFAEGVKLVAPSGEFAYPDVLVGCGAKPLSADRVETAAVVIEVLSRSTADYDRGSKWEMYREVPGLECYLLIEQDRRRAAVYRRDGDAWRHAIVTEGVIRPMADIELPLDEIYADVRDLAG